MWKNYQLLKKNNMPCTADSTGELIILLKSVKLRRIFKERFNNGEIILDQSSVEQTPFPQHQNEGAVMTCVFEEMSPTPLSGGTDGDEIFVNLAEPLLRTKLFKEFFDSLDFGESAQWEATNYLLSVAQRHGRNVVWLAILWKGFPKLLKKLSCSQIKITKCHITTI